MTTAQNCLLHCPRQNPGKPCGSEQTYLRLNEKENELSIWISM